MKSNLYKDWLQVVKILEKPDKLRLGLVSVIQFCLAILDLIGVAIIGVIGALSVYGIQSKKPGTRVTQFLEITKLSQFSFQTQVAVLGLIASSFLIIKTLISAYILRRTLFYTSRRGAQLSKMLFEKIVANRLYIRHRYTHQQFVYNATTSVDALTTGVLGATVTLFSDFSLLLLMFIGLIYFNPTLSISVTILFIILTYISNKFLSSTAVRVGKEAYEFAIRANETLVEFLKTYREAIVRNQENQYIEQFASYRLNSAKVAGTRQFIGYIPKYLMEISLVIGGIAIAAIQLSISDVSRAIGTLSIFIAAATRIAPAIMRIQQGTMNLKSSLSNTKTAIEFLQLESIVSNKSKNNLPPNRNLSPNIEIKNLNFRYDTSDFQLSISKLSINPRTQTAFVGPSGSGKTTLVDLILGIQKPTSGTISISELDPNSVHNFKPHFMGYVPQDAEIVNGSIKHNILLGLNENDFSETLIWDVLKQVKLEEFVKNLPDKLSSQVGESGAKLSGGQRQRLGIARALITKPEILVLDEATSALDSETENAITQSMQQIRKEATLIIIAHRLSTVRNSDQIIYIDGGKIKAIGSFDEVVGAVPDFAKQAHLMGLV